MAQKFIMGIDPGLKGAIAVLEPGLNHPLTYELHALIDIPLHRKNAHKHPNAHKSHQSSKSQRSEIDLPHLHNALEPYLPETAYVVLERVHSMPRDGHVGAFSFGRAYGEIRGLITASKKPIRLVNPSVWKKGMKLRSASKDESLELARILFPDKNEFFLRKKDDGRAEAALIAIWGAMFLGNK